MTRILILIALITLGFAAENAQADPSTPSDFQTECS